MKRNFTPIYIGQDTTGAEDIDELERLSQIEQAEKDARAERITGSISDLLVTGFGLFKSDSKDSTKAAASGSGTAAAPSVNVTVPGTNINAGMLIVPAAIIGGIMLLTSRRRRR